LIRGIKMDAVKPFFAKTALLFSFALLVPAAAFSQPAFVLNGSTTNATTVGLASNLVTQVSIGSTAASIGFSASVDYSVDGNNPNNVRWLCLNPQGGTVGTCDSVTGLSTPNTFNLQIGTSSALFPLGPHSAVINLTPTDGSGATAAQITVNYTTSATGGGGGTGAITVSSTTLSAYNVIYPAIASVNFTLSTSSNTAIAYTLTAGQTWMVPSVLSGSVSSSSSPQYISVSLNGTGFPQGTLSNTLTLTYGGQSVPITITFGNGVFVNGTGGGSSGSLSVNPNPVSLSYATNSYQFPSATVSVNGTSGLGFNATVQSTGNWLLINGNTNIQGTLPTTLTLSGDSNVQNIVGGSTAIVTISAFDGTSIQLQVNLTINGSNTTGISISPSPISLSTPLGGQSVSQTVTIATSIGGPVSASISGSGLSISQQPVNPNLTAGGSTTMMITANPSGLSSQTYLGTLSITVGGSTQNVSVSFTVGNGNPGSGGGGGVASIAAGPTSMSFVYEPGFSNPQNQATQNQLFYLAGTGNYTATVATQNGGNWLSLSNSSGTLPAQGTIIANASGLSAGTYTGSVSFLNTTSGTTAVVSVTMLITNTASITASPGDFVFSYIAGTNNAQQFSTVSLVTTDGSTLPITGAVSNPSVTPWLTFTNNATSTGGSVLVNATGLANGVYTGFITATGNAPNSPINFPVVLNVAGSSSSGGGGNTSGVLTLGQSAITFTPSLNGLPVTQQLTVNATTTTNFTASASTQNGNNTWLQISPFGPLQTNQTLTVTATPAGLAAGTYSGQITLVANGVTQTVPVTMVVGGTGSTGGNLSISVNGTVTASPSLSFTTQTVGGPVSSQTITVSSATNSSYAFSAAVTGATCGWVTLTINQNQTYQLSQPQPVTIGANTTGIASGTYNCTLTLNPTGGTAVTIPLSLTVVGQPTVSVTTTGPLSFSYAAGSATPASQTITLAGSGSSSASFTAVATTTSGANWLSVSPASGTIASGSTMPVTVSVNPANLTAGTYNGSISINGGAGTTGSGIVNVTLTVTAPTPNISTIVNGASFINAAVAPGEFVSIIGSQLGPATPLGPPVDANGNLTTSQGNVQVFFGGTAAPLTYVSGGQVNCIVPYEVAGLSTIQVQLKYLGQPSNTMVLSVQSSAPGIFSASGTGTGQAAILNSNNTHNSSGNPAAKGSVIQIFMTGEGVTNPNSVDGVVTGNATTVPFLPVAVNIGGQPATVVFKAEAPGIVAGILQLNVTVPPNIPSGTNSLSVTIGSNVSQPNLTIQVQ
jgi:uncharacterized protein (TIGR03437 family)